MIKSIEVEKDRSYQMQSGEWKLTFVINPVDVLEGLMLDLPGTRYAMALVKIDEVEENEGLDNKIVTKAVMYCKNRDFQHFCVECLACHVPDNLEDNAKHCIYDSCNIRSRKELKDNLKAADKFDGIINAFNHWSTEKRYKSNLERSYD